MLNSFFRSVILYFSIMITLRFMGKRQIGQLETSELVTAILLSEVAAIPIQSPEIPLSYGFVPLVTLAVLEYVQSTLAARSMRLRQIICGRPSVIVRNGVPDQEKLKELRINAAELLAELRLKDVFDLQEVDCAILETNGRLSVRLAPKERTVRARDIGADVGGESSRIRAVIVQGTVLDDNLKAEGKDRKWMEKILRENGVKSERDVYLMTLDDCGKAVVFPKE